MITCGRSRRMTSTSRPTASSRSALAKAFGMLVGLGVGHARVAVAEHDDLVVADDLGGQRQLLAPHLVQPLADLGRVHGRVEDVALLAAGAADEHGVHTLGVVPGDGAGALRRLVVGMGVHAQQAERFGHHPVQAIGCHVRFDPRPAGPSGAQSDGLEVLRVPSPHRHLLTQGLELEARRCRRPRRGASRTARPASDGPRRVRTR